MDQRFVDYFFNFESDPEHTLGIADLPVGQL